MAESRRPKSPEIQQVAGKGLLDRRALLGRGMVFAGTAAVGVGAIARAAAEPLQVDPWSKTIGAPVPPRSEPSHFVQAQRTTGDPSRPGTMQARTPHHLLDGMITPAQLHFVVARAGAPDIDPDKHKLLI